MVLSVFSFIKDKKKLQVEYDSYISMAEESIEEELYADAIGYYEMAQKLKPSLDIDIEIINCHKAQDQDSEKLYKKLLDKYPKEQGAYEYVVDYYIDEALYTEAYEIMTTAQNKGIPYEDMFHKMEEHKYKYKLEKTKFANLGIYMSEHCVMQNEDGAYGIVDSSGKTVLKAKYKQMSFYSSEMLAVEDEDGGMYWIDLKGNRKKNYKGEDSIIELGAMVNGIFRARLEDGSYAYYNSECEKISELYNDATTFLDGIAAVRSGSWYLIDESMQKVNDVPYAVIQRDVNGCISKYERLFVSEGRDYIMIDTTGQQIGDNSFEDARLFTDGTAAAVKQDGKWGFVNLSGEVIIEPKYNDARSFCNGFAAVNKDGKWGFINEDGEMVIEPKFDEVRDFTSSRICFVKEGSVWKILSFYF